MKKSSLAEIVIKIWAVFLLVSAARVLPLLIGQIRIGGLVSLESVEFLLTVLAGVVLLLIARPLAARLARPDDPIGSVEQSGSLEATGFGCAGLYFIVTGLTDLAALLWEIFGKPAQSYLTQGAPQQLAPAIVQVAAGLTIFMARRRLGSLTAPPAPRR